MARPVRASIAVQAPPPAAETLWLDTSRWPTWVDGLGHVHSVSDGWPAPGGRVIWDSTPAGRGRVFEKLREREPGASLTLDVEDETLVGTQRVAFFADGEGAAVIELELEYTLKSRGPLMPVVNLLFVRRAMAGSLQRTLRRFAIELAAEREPAV